MLLAARWLLVGCSLAARWLLAGHPLPTAIVDELVG